MSDGGDTFSWSTLGNLPWETIGQIGAGVAGWLGGGSDGGDQTTYQRPYFYPGQEENLALAGAAAKSQFESGPQSYYPGATVAQMDPTRYEGQNMLLGARDQMYQGADAANLAGLQLAQGGAGRIGGFTLPDQIGFGIPQEYQNAIMDPIMNNLQERIIPGIHTAATQQGAFGGSRMQQQKADATAQATRDATNAMIQGNLQARNQSIGQRAGDIKAQLSGRSQDIQQNQLENAAMYNAAQALSTGSNLLARPGDLYSRVGQDREDYAQSLIDADRARFDWTRNEDNRYIDQLFDRMYGGQFGVGQRTTLGQQATTGDKVFGALSGLNLWNQAMQQPQQPQQPRV